MKLQDWLNKKRWNTAVFSRESGISLATLRKLINGTGGINLDIALRIEKMTNGEVKTWDLSLNAENIKKGRWPLHDRAIKDDSKECKKKNDENDLIVDNF